MTAAQALWHSLHALWGPVALALLASGLLKLPGPWGTRSVPWTRLWMWGVIVNGIAYGVAWFATGHEGSMVAYGAMVVANAAAGYALGLHARRITKHTRGHAASGEVPR